MRISDWSSDVCSSDLDDVARLDDAHLQPGFREIEGADEAVVAGADNQRVIGFGHRNSFASGDWTCWRPKPTTRTRPGMRRSSGMRVRKSVGWGKSVAVRVDWGGGGLIKNNIASKNYNKKEVNKT